jgi:cytosine/adenosine deaminase-related metal-dependent hydrolase
MPLVEWLPLAIAERQSRSHIVAASISAGLKESVAAGICAVGEIATADPENYEFQTVVEQMTFLEVIGFSRARAVSAFDALTARLASAKNLSWIGLSPHAPYTVSPQLLGEIINMARAQDLPVAMHLAECEEELDLLATGGGPLQQLLESRGMWDSAAIPSGSRPLDYLHILSGAPRALVIHGNYLDALEHEFLAAHADRMALVYCPRTHAYFNHPPYPLDRLIGSGVRVVLGTDSRASNPDLSILGEMRHLTHAHSNIPPETILRMATLATAEALGCERDYGSITPGKLANLIAVPASSDSLAETLARVEAPTAIWLKGRER